MKVKLLKPSKKRKINKAWNSFITPKYTDIELVEKYRTSKFRVDEK